MLARALGLKKIDDLTELIRELVLEASGVKDDARRVVDEFADLVAIHERLLDARNQRDHLIRFPDLDRSLRSSEAEIKRLTAQLDALPVYMGNVVFACGIAGSKGYKTNWTRWRWKSGSWIAMSKKPRSRLKNAYGLY